MYSPCGGDQPGPAISAFSPPDSVLHCSLPAASLLLPPRTRDNVGTGQSTWFQFFVLALAAFRLKLTPSQSGPPWGPYFAPHLCWSLDGSSLTVHL